MRKIQNLFDRLMYRMGYVRSASLRQRNLLDFSGHVYLDHKDPHGEVVKSDYLGENTLTYPFRIAVMRLLARKALNVPVGVTYPSGVSGLDASDDVFPARLYLGLGTTGTSAEDVALDYYLTTEDDPSGEPIFFPLRRIDVYSTKDSYDTVRKPINVAFEFDIPLGELREGVHKETTPYVLTEFGLSTDSGSDPPVLGPSDGTAQTPQADPPLLLARKRLSFPKIFEGAFTVRWEIRG